MLQPGTLVEQLSPSQFASTFSTLKEISKEICIKLLLVYIIGLLGFRSNILVLHMYCTNYSAYIKAVPCIILLTEYIIQSYFVHFQSLFSLSSYSQHGIKAIFLWSSPGRIRRSSVATGSRSLPRDRKPFRRFCLPRNPHL